MRVIIRMAASRRKEKEAGLHRERRKAEIQSH
jgi:hypothetical protein